MLLSITSRKRKAKSERLRGRGHTATTPLRVFPVRANGTLSAHQNRERPEVFVDGPVEPRHRKRKQQRPSESPTAGRGGHRRARERVSGRCTGQRADRAAA